VKANYSKPPKEPSKPSPPPTAKASFLAPNTLHHLWKCSSGQFFESPPSKLHPRGVFLFQLIFSSAGGVLFPSFLLNLRRSTPEGQSPDTSWTLLILLSVSAHQIEADSRFRPLPMVDASSPSRIFPTKR
jgi:hypothetical protein